MNAHKKTVAAVAIVLTIVFGSISASPSYATGDPDQLDQGDFTQQYQQQYQQAGWQAHLYGSTVVDWKCFYNDGPLSVWTSERKSIDIAGYCWRLWGRSAQYHNYNDPYSWYCK